MRVTQLVLDNRQRGNEVVHRRAVLGRGVVTGGADQLGVGRDREDVHEGLPVLVGHLIGALDDMPLGDALEQLRVRYARHRVPAPRPDMTRFLHEHAKKRV